MSGAQSFNRPGYQRLVPLVALREAGIVFGLVVSRLARNSLDWYQLLELAAAFDVLIADEDGVYNPAEFNDRLLKGTIAEVELYQIKARMVRGRLNKAQRGDLIWNVPIGLEYDVLSGQIRLDADQIVRHAVELVFRLFWQLGWRSIKPPSRNGTGWAGCKGNMQVARKPCGLPGQKRWSGVWEGRLALIRL